MNSPTQVIPTPSGSYFLRMPEVLRRVGYKRTQIYMMIREGRFPKGYQIGPRAVAWDSHEVDEWIEKRKSQSQK